jgi:hypothetical protein
VRPRLLPRRWVLRLAVTLQCYGEPSSAVRAFRSLPLPYEPRLRVESLDRVGNVADHGSTARGKATVGPGGVSFRRRTSGAFAVRYQQFPNMAEDIAGKRDLYKR